MRGSLKSSTALPPLAISTKTGEGLDTLIQTIASIARERLSFATEAPSLTHTRHRHHLETAAGALDAFLSGDAASLELRAEDVRQAAHALGRITGRVDVEDVLDQIFSSFCIGK